MLCDTERLVIGGQGVRLQALCDLELSVGDKVLIKISHDDFKKWLTDGRYLIRQVMDIKISSPNRNSTKLSPLLKTHSYELIKSWNHFIDVIRGYFKHEGFIETPTPGLVCCPGMEYTLEPFATTLSMGRNQKKFFLPTSPELHLKKLLSQGWSEIFEVKQCFRNGELSHHHQPEFTLLEWYRAYDSLDSMACDIENLISKLHAQNLVVKPIGNFQRHSLSQLFAKHTGLELTPSTTKETLVEYCCRHLSQPVDDRHTWDDLFHLIFLTQIESHLGQEGPEFIYNFPPSQAALAQINSQGWADRLEIYWRGLEIGNAFNELLDPVEHRQRFKKEMALREQMGRTKVPIDEEFMEALEGGLPPCAGMAVGLERLFLACQSLYKLEDLRLFPLRLQP